MSLLNNQFRVRHYFNRLGSEVVDILDSNDQRRELGVVVGVPADVAGEDVLPASEADNNAEA